MAMSQEPNFGTFERPSDGKTIKASSADDAVRWRYAGWREVQPPSKDAAAQMEGTAEEQPAPKRSGK